MLDLPRDNPEVAILGADQKHGLWGRNRNGFSAHTQTGPETISFPDSTDIVPRYFVDVPSLPFPRLSSGEGTATHKLLSLTLSKVTKNEIDPEVGLTKC